MELKNKLKTFPKKPHLNKPKNRNKSKNHDYGLIGERAFYFKYSYFIARSKYI